MTKNGFFRTETDTDYLRRLIGRLGIVLGYLFIVHYHSLLMPVSADASRKSYNLRQNNHRENREQKAENSSSTTGQDSVQRRNSY